ncbi:hypothetical protein [Domibacillus robiginosus]|uniref:hypothetical protein n=1 Tax=Domibacillus robiginosus TaxID=1071054 RepID=UPI00067B6B8F|nr:hypothetical protein [Domibacillus robiginosus]
MEEQIPEKVPESDPVKNSPTHQISEEESELPEAVFESDFVKNISGPDRQNRDVDKAAFDWVEMVRKTSHTVLVPGTAGMDLDQDLEDKIACFSSSFFLISVLLCWIHIVLQIKGYFSLNKKVVPIFTKTVSTI